MWCCYAWPAVWRTSGRRAFFIDQAGDVFACDNEKQRYPGLGHPPRADFTHWTEVQAEPAVKVMNGQGPDGETWTVIN